MLKTRWAHLQVIDPPGSNKFEFSTRQQWAHRQEWNNFNSEQFYQSTKYAFPPQRNE